MGGAALVVLGLAVVPGGSPNRPPGPDDLVVVFRYHPGLLPDREARRADDRAILQALEQTELSYRSEGGLGRGFEVEVSRRDLGRWKATISRLIEGGVLRYYRWGTDDNGYGLVPIP